jgi:NADP-dependent 3-hydroxy acid dehydrogenase YdfG
VPCSSRPASWTGSGTGACGEGQQGQVVGAHGVRVSIVEPGYTDTELPAGITDAEARAGIEGVMAGQRNLDSEDVAATILHIVSRPPHVVINELQVLPLSQT